MLLVAGGYIMSEASNRRSIDSTEIYMDGDFSWTMFEPLPTVQHNMGFATINNVFYLTG